MPPAYRPQLAKLVRQPPLGDDWLHEMKYDGYRIGCTIRRGVVTLTTRNGNDWTDAFPEIVDAAARLPASDALLDGEVAILMPDGRTSFQALQNAFTAGGARRGLVYFVFDLLRLDGARLERRPLEARKEALRRLVGRRGPRARLRFAEHVVGRGAEMFDEACRLRLEGIISKRRDAAYTPGRSDLWVKTKCVARQELVIGGFTDPEGSRQGIGALLVGYYDRDRLVFAGKVGTGFSVAVARALRAQLERLEQSRCPFVPAPAGWLGKHAHWVEPRLVAEVAFTEWTGDGRIRHPSFQGLREDKDPRTVVREEPGGVAPAPGSGISVAKSQAPRGRPARGPVSSGVRRKGTGSGDSVVVAGIRISHPDRLVFEQPRVTKADLARFFERMADWILPHLRGRPLTLVRCPEGTRGDCFYMKHSKVWAPGPVRRVLIPEKTKVGEYLVVDTLPALVGLVQMNVLEFHTWNTCVDHVEHPDRVVLDIDPGAEVPWAHVVEAARLVRRLLRGVGLESCLKTTGGRGLHVVVPLAPRHDWQECLAFSRAVASAMERSDPDRYTTAFAKAGRARKILIDYLRNNRTNTSVAAFSTRARPGAPVSVPLRWTELTSSLDPAAFTVATIEQRLARLRSDPWQEYWTSRQALPRGAQAVIDAL